MAIVDLRDTLRDLEMQVVLCWRLSSHTREMTKIVTDTSCVHFRLWYTVTRGAAPCPFDHPMDLPLIAIWTQMHHDHLVHTLNRLDHIMSWFLTRYQTSEIREAVNDTRNVHFYMRYMSASVVWRPESGLNDVDACYCSMDQCSVLNARFSG